MSITTTNEKKKKINTKNILKLTKKKIAHLPITYLTNKDFEEGTYKINKKGKYVFKEDIVFNPNKYPNFLDSPENHKRMSYYWMPRPDQTRYKGKEFDHGFFCAILIETKDVIIDLNGHSIKQHPLHYLQQRFFSLFCLGSSPFIKNQGPGGNWGDFIGAENCVIYSSKPEPGIIGLSSHFGIQGNDSKFIHLENLKIIDFESGGISFNNIDDLYMKNLYIGDVHKEVIVNFNYSGLLAIKKIFSKIIKNNKKKIKQIYFNDKNLFHYNKKINLIIDRIVRNFYHSNYKSIFNNSDDPIEKEIKKLFDNEFTDGFQFSDGSSSFGIQITSRGIAIGDFKVFSQCPCNHKPNLGEEKDDIRSKNIIIDNVEINEIHANIKQIINFSVNNDEKLEKCVGSFGEILQLDTCIDEDGLYIPNILTDSQLILKKLKDHSTKILLPENTIRIPNHVIEMIENKQNLLNLDENVTSTFGEDIMSHVNKGTMGIRLENIDNIQVKDLKINNIVNHGKDKKKKYFGKEKIVINKISEQLGNNKSWLGSFGAVLTSCDFDYNSISFGKINSKIGLNMKQIILSSKKQKKIQSDKTFIDKSLDRIALSTIIGFLSISVLSKIANKFKK